MNDSSHGLKTSWLMSTKSYPLLSDLQGGEWQESPMGLGPLLTYDTLSSTMTQAQELLYEKPLPFCVRAHVQTAGYGRQQRKWESPRGNLFFTLALPSIQGHAHSHHLSFVASLSVFDALLMVYPQLKGRMTLKWPNDILVDEKKVSGVLIEAVSDPLSAALIGVGINTQCAPIFGAGSLEKLEKNKENDLILEKFLLCFVYHLDVLKKKGFEATLCLWRSFGPQKGTWVKLHFQNKTYQGHFIKIDDNGGVCINIEHKTHVFNSGDFFFS